jgi:hypothetical protein
MPRSFEVQPFYSEFVTISERERERERIRNMNQEAKDEFLQKLLQ